MLRTTQPIRLSSPLTSLTATSLPYASRANFSTTQSRPELPNWLHNVYKRRDTPYQTLPQRPPPTLTSPAPKPARTPSRLKTGTVVSVGRMDRTVTVHERAREWDRHIRKYYPKINKVHVSDPRNSLREGDVVQFSSGTRKTRRVTHVVEKIVSPFGVGVAERPPVMTPEEREAESAEKRARKDGRRFERAKELLAAGEDGQERVREFEELWNAEADTVRVGRIKGLVNNRLTLAEKRAKAGGYRGETLP
ncbi:hypothetical protein PHISP_01408 [Aspergillus sp. HF37]|nr:hypothetical protein PHISP_01408 [Aspergillus sp. HF37]